MSLESESRESTRHSKTRDAILASLKVGSLLSVAIIAPNVAGLLGRVYSKQEARKTYNAIKRLAEKGLVEYTAGSVRITHKGYSYLAKFEKGPRPSRWDKKWRVVIFDVSESRKSYRNALRMTLQSIGFAKLQHSVWVYPYDCEELVALLKLDYRLGTEVLYLIVDKLENDAALKRHFSL